MNNLFSDKIEIGNLDTAKLLIEECRNGFYKLFDNSPACMSITTLDRKFTSVNKKFLDIFGFASEEILGRNSLEIGILEPKEYHRISTQFVLQGGIQNELVTCKTKSNQYVYTVSSIEIIESDGKHFFVSTFLNITDLVIQQRLIAQQHQEILDSINYARYIQSSIFPSESQISELLPDSFLLAKPKNIVSGDFYWIKKQGDKVFVAACDCTGHGVPGAFISIIGYKLLDKFIDEYGFSKPAEILNQLNKEYANADKSLPDHSSEIVDGMDIALCVIDKSKMTMEYAGAYNPVYRVRNGELTALMVDKIPIYLFKNHSNQHFNNYEIELQQGDTFYLFSDGYADQFGGPNNKKFRYKNLQQLILTANPLPMVDQKKLFNQTIEEWKLQGGEDQTDDILLVGFRV
jgi:PAS domain S-box-containing protein